MAKDIHPAVSPFSERDWYTGWIHPEVREYKWGFVEPGKAGSGVKHAIEPPVTRNFTDPDVMRTYVRNLWHANNYVAECGFWPDGPGQWLNSRYDPVYAFDLPRCPDCLKAIGAPPLPSLRKDRRRRKRKGEVNRDFNYVGDPGLNLKYAAKLTPDDVRFIRSSGLTLRELAERFGVSQSTISYARSGKNWKGV